MGVTKTATGRMDVVFIRKSTAVQDEQGQKRNVENMLREIAVQIPESL